jgi:hypothetical protein
VVADASGQGLELAGFGNPNPFKLQFSVRHMIVATPSTLILRIFNLADSTAQRIRTFATRPPTPTGTVTVQAGYAANFGTIFMGQIKQVRVGRISNLDTYCDILAGDMDDLHNWGAINQTLAAGWTQQDVLTANTQVMADKGVKANQAPTGLDQQKSTRGKVMFGMVRDTMSDWSKSTKVDWSVQNGNLTLCPTSSVLPGQAVVLNSATGLIGFPEQTQDGIMAKCLLNPNIAVGGIVQINNADVQELAQQLGAGNIPQPFLPGTSEAATVPAISADGFYKVLWVNHLGDTRGNDYFTEMALLSTGPTFTPASTAQLPVWARTQQPATQTTP